ncbi:hypothetical protein DPMN_118925 [Dreissena polymorpha]|uniref:Uncharacterized protein n=1 Tax=Dreissena polymorpha TaxID=45954 RepID=A0A9D4GL13_DREPO|nr:hypothetical protein DPMN_118925 [Dreissena polymorpha]
MSNTNSTNHTNPALDTGFSWKNTSRTGCSYTITEPEVDTTLCGRGGSLKERRCQLFKLTTLAILPGIILIVRDAVKVANDVKVLFNPVMPSGLSHPSKLDQFISKIRDV